MWDLAGPRLFTRARSRTWMSQRIQEEWDGLDQRVIDSAVKEWRK